MCIILITIIIIVIIFILFFILFYKIIYFIYIITYTNSFLVSDFLLQPNILLYQVIIKFSFLTRVSFI